MSEAVFKAFSEFCGNARFNRFVEEIRNYADRKKVLFWQEELWEAFVAQSDLQLPAPEDAVGIHALFDGTAFRPETPDFETFEQNPYDRLRQPERYDISNEFIERLWTESGDFRETITVHMRDLHARVAEALPEDQRPQWPDPVSPAERITRQLDEAGAPDILKELVAFDDEIGLPFLDFRPEVMGPDDLRDTGLLPDSFTGHDHLLAIGVEGTGGFFALWKQGNGGLDEAPVFHRDSEGGHTLLASDLRAFLSLFAAGHYLADIEEEAECDEDETANRAAMAAWLRAHDIEPAQSVMDVVRAAQKKFPGLDDFIGEN